MDSVITALICVMGSYFVGLDLIDAYFKRKEKFVDKLQEKLKGNLDGTGE